MSIYKSVMCVRVAERGGDVEGGVNTVGMLVAKHPSHPQLVPS